VTAIDLSVRRAGVADAETVGRLLHDLNREFDEPTPGARAVAERVRALLEADEMIVLLGGGGPHGVGVLRFRPALWTDGLDCYLEELYIVPEHRRHGLRPGTDGGRHRPRSAQGSTRDAPRHL
jgi:hypothetical protein